MRSVLIVLLSFLIINSVSAQTDAEKEILDVLKKQEMFWNEGNIAKFMDGYWKSDSLLFVGSSGPSYGWQTTLDRYKKRYPGKDAMGTLHFDIREIKSLSSEYGFVVGKWSLTRNIGDIGGYFSLLFRKINGKWVIIADHTS